MLRNKVCILSCDSKAYSNGQSLFVASRGVSKVMSGEQAVVLSGVSETAVNVSAAFPAALLAAPSAVE